MGESILAQVYRLEEKHADQGTADLLAHVRIETIELTDTDLRGLWRQFRVLKLPATLEDAVYLDAPRFEVAHVTAMNDWKYRLYGPSSQSRAPHPLIKWASALRRVVLAKSLLLDRQLRP